MKYLLFLPICLLTMLSSHGQSYRLNDTMYIWEMHGAEIVEHPTKTNQILGKHYYGSTARIVDTDIGKYHETREVIPGFNLQGNWVKAIVDQDTGYIFDGYLSHLKSFDLRSDETGITLVQKNFLSDETVSKGIRSFENGELGEGQSLDIQFENGIHWNLKNIQSCMLETYSYPGARLTEAYEFMMAVYSNYFDQNATYMSEPQFVRMNGNKFEFKVRSDKTTIQITLYNKGNAYVISSYSCPDKPSTDF